MSELNNEQHKQWFEAQRPTYELLTNTVKNTLESLIKNVKIDYLSITARTKEIDSFVEKIGRKNYQNPSQEVTDLAGIRVITFIESDALKVNELIKNSFNVDDSKSLDKSDELGIDKFGYRSFHFVCDLGEARCALPEFSLFQDLVFEIQVRTVLQHAWAEIEHDRNYKFAGELPPSIKRRLHLLAGVLELTDREFNNLATELDNYSIEVSNKTKKGDFAIELNTISLKQYLETKLSKLDLPFKYNLNDKPEFIEEMRAFGINGIAKLDELITPEYITALKDHKSEYTTAIGFIRSVMMYADIKKYFNEAYSGWGLCKENMFNLLSSKYGEEDVLRILTSKDIVVGEVTSDKKIFITRSAKNPPKKSVRK